jgi:molybdate transport system substrate-binding protein
MEAIGSLLRRLLLIGCLAVTAAARPAPLLVFAGAASKPPLDELARTFEQQTGQRVGVVYGGSGFVLSQMRLAKRGDIYFPGSSDFMELAKRLGCIVSGTERRLAFLVPAINVQAGNPKGIHGLKDLLNPGLRVAIANPENVCVGTYAVEVVEASLSPAERVQFRKNLLNFTESCEKTATAVSMKAVDAVLGWSVFQYWDPARIQTVPLPADQIRRVGYIPAAVATFSKQPERARLFLDFVDAPAGHAVFARHHYFTTPEEAFAWLGGPKPVGGDYTVPRSWLDGSR